MNTNRRSGRQSASMARPRRRLAGRHFPRQASAGTRQANAGDLPVRGTISEDAVKVWNVIAKHRDARRALEARHDAKSESEKDEADCDNAGDLAERELTTS